MLNIPVCRIARPTDDIDALLPFYQAGLGLTLLHRFENHQGFDGIILGNDACPYHFEFTRAHAHKAGRSPTFDHLIVFYLPDKTVWNAAIRRMADSGFEPVRAFNPYWDVSGRTFEDPDGYRLVLQCAAWPESSRPADDTDQH